jgi:hypothetical protein
MYIEELARKLQERIDTAKPIDKTQQIRHEIAHPRFTGLKDTALVSRMYKPGLAQCLGPKLYKVVGICLFMHKIFHDEKQTFSESNKYFNCICIMK